jgi:hypothetical protein
MMGRTQLLLVCTTAFVIAGLLACDKERSPRLFAPTSPGSGITRIEIGGPSSVAPGEVVQLTATAHLTDGSSRDVTTEAIWNSSNRIVLSISPDGRATGHVQGEALVTAFSNVTSTREVIVVPRGTYRVVGLVTEAGGPSWPVIGATVAVTAGLGAGLVATTGEDGRYRLYGVAGDVELRITKDGYQPRAQQYRIADHVMVNAQLELLNPRRDVSGTYTLTIAAAETCRAELPEELRLRNYTAVLTLSGNQLDVRLQGATFAGSGGRGGRFGGRAEPTQLLFVLSPFQPESYGYYGLFFGDVVERLTESTHLGVSGLARAPESGSGFSGSLDGSIAVLSGGLKSFPSVAAECRSAAHGFMLRRQVQ